MQDLEISSILSYYGLFSFNTTIFILFYLIYKKFKYDNPLYSLKDLQNETLKNQNEALLKEIEQNKQEVLSLKKDNDELSKIILNKLK